MSTFKATTRFAHVVVSLLSLALAWPVHAQAPRPRAVLAVADSLPITQVKGVVVFRSEPTGQHVVLVQQSTVTPELLGALLALVRRLEREHRDDAVSIVVPVSGAGEHRPMSAARRAQLTRYLREVNGRTRTRLGDAGFGRWIALPSSELSLD